MPVNKDSHWWKIPLPELIVLFGSVLLGLSQWPDINFWVFFLIPASALAVLIAPILACVGTKNYVPSLCVLGLGAIFSLSVVLAPKGDPDFGKGIGIILGMGLLIAATSDIVRRGLFNMSNKN